MTISAFAKSVEPAGLSGYQSIRRLYCGQKRAEAAQRQARFDAEVEAVAVRRRVHLDEARWLLNQRWRGVL